MTLIGNVFKPLAKNLLIPLGLTAVSSATDAAVNKKMFGSGNTILIISNEETNDIIKTNNPTGTQRPEVAPYDTVWNIPDHNRTKIGSITFLTYYGSPMSDLHLVSRNIETFLPKPILWTITKLIAWGRQAVVSLWDVLKTFSGRLSKTERPWNN